jgi:cyclase
MLKTRIIGVIIIKAGIVVQSIRFKKYLPVGKPSIAVEYLNKWGIDEIILLDIDASIENRRPNFDLLRECSKYCQVPLTFGGGIKDLSDIRTLISLGADKVVINSAIAENPELISEGAEKFGKQCIVASIDPLIINGNRYDTFINSGTVPTGRTPEKAAEIAEKYGAGEIMVNSIDRDGSKNGYDLALIDRIMDIVSVPVVICGGVGNPRHFLEAMRLNVSGVAAGNFFHFFEHSVIVAKSCLKALGEDIRLDTYAEYNDIAFDDNGRITKRNDSIFENLRFEYIPEEII